MVTAAVPVAIPIAVAPADDAVAVAEIVKPLVTKIPGAIAPKTRTIPGASTVAIAASRVRVRAVEAVEAWGTKPGARIGKRPVPKSGCRGKPGRGVMEPPAVAVEARSAERPRAAAIRPCGTVRARPATMKTRAAAGKTSAGRGKMPDAARAGRERTTTTPMTRLSGLQHRNTHDRHTAEYSNNFHNPILRGSVLEKQACSIRPAPEPLPPAAELAVLLRQTGASGPPRSRR